MASHVGAVQFAPKSGCAHRTAPASSLWWKFWATCPKRHFPSSVLRGNTSTTPFRTTTAQVRFADIHVSLCQGEGAVLLARSGERALQPLQNSQSRTMPLGKVPAFAEPDIHSLSQAYGPSQKIEFVFAASPRNNSERASREFDLLRSVGNGGTWQPAHCGFCTFQQPFALALYSSVGTKSRPARSTASR